MTSASLRLAVILAALCLPGAASAQDLASAIADARAHSPALAVAAAEADAAAQKDGVLEKGKKALADTFSCTDCHKFHDKGEGGAPDLTGYGSRDWMVRMISNPAHDDFYGSRNDRMPAFAAKPAPPKANLLRDEELLLIVRWLRGEDLSK